MTQSTWDEYATDWDANDDVRLYADKAFESWSRKVAPLMTNLTEARVLDFGCGTGLLSAKLSPLCRHVVAVDSSKGMIDVLRAKIEAEDPGNITPLATSISRVTIGDFPELRDSFDLVLASSVCSFLPDYELTLNALSSILKPGGFFVQWDWLDDMPIARIRDAYDAARLTTISVEGDFEMTGEENSMPVVMGVAQLP